MSTLKERIAAKMATQSEAPATSLKERIAAKMAAPVEAVQTPQEAPVQAVQDDAIDYGFGTEPADPSVPQTTGLEMSAHVAGGFNKMIVDTLNLPFAASGWLGEKVLGGDPEDSFDLYDVPAVGNFLKEATAPELERGEAPILDAARTGLEWGGGGLLTAGKNVLNKAPALANTAMDMFMGAGAAAGGAVGGETGEMVGGATGMIVDALRGKMPKARGEAAKATDKALDFVESNMLDATTGKEVLKGNLDEGIQGTLLDLTEDTGLAAIERPQGWTDKGKIAIARTQAAREAQAIDDMRAPFGEETGAAAQAIADNKTSTRKLDIERQADAAIKGRQAEAEQGLAQTRAQIQQADDVAEEALQSQYMQSENIAPERPTYDVSRDTAQQIRAEEKAFELADETPKWDKFKDGPPIATRGLREVTAKDSLDVADETYRAMQREYKSTFDDIDNWGVQVDPKSIAAVRSAVQSKINAAADFGPVERGMKQVVDAIDAKVLQDGNTLYADAVASTKTKHERFRAGDVGKARKATRETPEAFLESLPLSGDRGVASARQIKTSESPEAIAGVQEFFRGKVKNETVDQAFMDKYDGFLSEFPTLKGEFADAAAANARGTEATGLSKALTKKLDEQAKGYAKDAETALPQVRAKADAATKQVDQGLTAKYAKDPQGTLDKLLKRGGERDLKKLNNSLSQSGARGSLKGQVGDILRQKLTSVESGSEAVRKSSLNELRELKPVLIDSGVLTADEFEKIYSAALRPAKSRGLRKAAGEVKYGKNNEEANALGASILSSLVLPAIPSANALLVGGALRRNFKALLRRRDYSPEALARVDEFTANPQSFIDALDARTQAKIKAATSVDEVANILSKAVFAGQALADDE